MPYLCLWRRNFCAAGGVLLWLQRCDFRTVKKPSPLTTAAQNMCNLCRKLLLLGNHFFVWLKTAFLLTACGTVTLKSLPSRGSDAPRVHLRPRKRPPRCTLDCGFKTSESPALRGFVAERAPIRGTSLYLVLKSNGLHCPKIRLKKFGFSPIDTPANIAKKLPSQRCFKPLFIAFFNFSHKCPTFAFTGKSGYTLGSAQKIAHKGTHGETGGLPALGHSAVLCRQRNSFYSTTPLYIYISRFSVNPHYQQQLYLRPSFIAFFSLSHKRPTFAFTGESGYTTRLHSKDRTQRPTRRNRGISDGGGITTLGAFCAVRKPCVAGCQNGKLCRFWVLV